MTVMLSDLRHEGTVVAIGKGGLPAAMSAGAAGGSERILLVDSLAAAAGGLFGQLGDPYIESGAGVAEGGANRPQLGRGRDPSSCWQFVGNRDRGRNAGGALRPR